jgi:hypothetical protein
MLGRGLRARNSLIASMKKAIPSLAWFFAGVALVSFWAGCESRPERRGRYDGEAPASPRRAPSRWRAQARFSTAGSPRPFRSRAASFPLRADRAGGGSSDNTMVAVVVAAAVGWVVEWAAEWVAAMVAVAVAAGWVVGGRHGRRFAHRLRRRRCAAAGWRPTWQSDATGDASSEPYQQCPGRRSARSRDRRFRLRSRQFCAEARSRGAGPGPDRRTGVGRFASGRDLRGDSREGDVASRGQKETQSVVLRPKAVPDAPPSARQ